MPATKSHPIEFRGGQAEQNIRFLFRTRGMTSPTGTTGKVAAPRAGLRGATARPKEEFLPKGPGGRPGTGGRAGIARRGAILRAKELRA